MKFLDAARSGRRDWLAEWKRFTAERSGKTYNDSPHPIRRGLPGTRLKNLLSGPPFWINVEHQGCQCEDRAQQMDRWGVEGCRANRDTIVAWLVESAKTRGWPFAPLVAPLLVDRAITLAASDEENA